uniref:Reverse transcriptase domain-containing protein n=1 Tax=Tanacetum cinerariifolium TaxID=118510 RepID=A0A699GQC7_TANCI|nr:reverse transcriptase domain-containing protein [Tanacetum cinerariifolium]
MEVMQAYDATNELPIPPLQAPIASPTVMPPVLSLFDSQDFLPLEEISPPKDTKTLVESTIPVSPSSSVGSSSPVRSITPPPDYPFDDLSSQRYPSSSRLIYGESLGTQFISSKISKKNYQATRLDPYHLQLSRIQPLDQLYRGLKVKFPIGTLTEDAFSWWHSYAKPIGIEQADKIAWSELKRLFTNKYCPRTEVKKMEDEFYNLVVKGNDRKTYPRRFQFLAVLCPNMVPNTKKLTEVFIGDYLEVLKEILLLQSLNFRGSH